MKVLFLLFALVFLGCGNDVAKKPNTPAGTCGNGRLDTNETCDPGIASGEGSCQVSCGAGSCETAELVGSANECNLRCVRTPQACADGDGCCPQGCDASTDSDCTNTCGNGTVETPEICDGNCPATCQGTACAPGVLVGSASTCDARCETEPIILCDDGDGCCAAGCDASNDSDCEMVGPSCGNGVVEAGELCDGNCPTACQPRNTCETASLQGSAAQCNAGCEYDPISACVGGDGCCPAGCTNATDSDCSTTCGNNFIEPGETCDGNCPTSCTAPNACTRVTLTGDEEQCNVRCIEAQITQCQNNDGCCAAGCTTANDNDCACQPSTCQQLGAECGRPGNGCGQSLNCGQCASNETCSNFQCVPVSNGSLGAPCTVAEDCSNGLGCVTTDTVTMVTYPNGYCTTFCAGLLAPCTEGVCIGTTDAGLPLEVGNCHKPCTSSAQCRGGYSCVSGGCYPN